MNLNIFGIRENPGSRFSAWHSLLYHGYAVRDVGSDTQDPFPFMDNQNRRRLHLTLNLMQKGKIISPDFTLCFPAELTRKLAGLFDIHYQPVIIDYDFSIEVSPNTQWPRDLASSAGPEEMIRFVRAKRSIQDQLFFEWICFRLIEVDAEAISNNIYRTSFKRRLHIEKLSPMVFSYDFLLKNGGFYYEGWYWFSEKMWHVLEPYLDFDYFYKQEIEADQIAG